MSTRKTEEVRDIARAADRDAPGPWVLRPYDEAEVVDVVDATGTSLLGREGFVVHRSVALHIAASDPQTVVALADRVLAHEGALQVFRTAITRLRDAHARNASGAGLVPTDVAIAQAFLFALIPPAEPVEPAATLDSFTTYYLLSKVESDEGAALGLPLLAFLRAEPVTGLGAFTYRLAEAAKVTEVLLEKGVAPGLIPVLCKEVDRVSMNGNVHNKHLPAIEKAAYGIASTILIPRSAS